MTPYLYIYISNVLRVRTSKIFYFLYLILEHDGSEYVTKALLF